MRFSYLFTAFNILFSICLANPLQNISPPGRVIDLGYAKHIPTYINTTVSGRRIAIYKNIRFALPPTGSRRFRKPDISLPNTEGVQDGKVPWGTTDCIASAPSVAPFPGINSTTWVMKIVYFWMFICRRTSTLPIRFLCFTGSSAAVMLLGVKISCFPQWGCLMAITQTRILFSSRIAIGKYLLLS
jgi:hypothetical protein